MPLSCTSSFVKKTYSLPTTAERAFWGRNTFLRCAFANTSRLCSRQGAETFLFLLLKSVRFRTTVEATNGLYHQSSIAQEAERERYTHTCSSTPTATQQAIPAARGGTVAKRGRGNVGGGKPGVVSPSPCTPSPSPSVYLSLCIKKGINN